MGSMVHKVMVPPRTSWGGKGRVKHTCRPRGTHSLTEEKMMEGIRGESWDRRRFQHQGHGGACNLEDVAGGSAADSAEGPYR